MSISEETNWEADDIIDFNTDEEQPFRCKLCKNLRFRTKAGALRHLTKKHKKPQITEPDYCENFGNEFEIVEVKVEPSVEIESYGTKFYIHEIPNDMEMNDHVENHKQNETTERPKRRSAKAAVPLYYESDDDRITPSKNIPIENENAAKKKRGRTNKPTPKKSSDNDLYIPDKPIPLGNEDPTKVKRSRQKRTASKKDKEAKENQQNGSQNDDCLGVIIKQEVDEFYDDEISNDGSNDSDYDDPYQSLNKSANKSRKSYMRLSAPSTRAKPLLLFKPTFTETCEDIQGYSQRKWLEFIQLNYVYDESLFREYLPKLLKVDENHTFENLLPSPDGSIKITMPTPLKIFRKFGKSNCEDFKWLTLNRFQSSTGTPTEKLIYLGAPIKSLHWIPLPTFVDEQYLILTYREDSSASAYMHFLNSNITDILLLLYKVTMINGCLEANIHYVLKIPNGPINTIAFLPSGGYDIKQNRLGLLAVGGIKSTVDIYALPIEPATKDFVNVDNNLKFRIVQLSTAFELILDQEFIESNLETHKLYETQCQRICWSEFSGHYNIFASFTNGYIAAWNIKSSKEDEINLCHKETKNGKHYFTPLTYFDFEESSVSGLALHYDTEGPRWLSAFAICRKHCVYDIGNIMEPIPIRKESLKTIARCMDWSPIWETFSIGMCDVVPNLGCALTVFNITGANFQHLNLANSAAGISQVHFNPWHNLTLFAADNGDVCILSTNELNVDIVKTKRNIIASIMDIICTENDKMIIDNENSISENEKEESHGIIFGEFSRISENSYNIYRDENRRPSPDQQLLTRINIASWNLNAPASSILAVGYENGILRLCKFDMENF